MVRQLGGPEGHEREGDREREREESRKAKEYEIQSTDC